MILADEGLNFNIIRDLRSEGYAVEWVKELGAGMKDEDIITLAKENKQVLITEDKDFGEWFLLTKLKG